MILERKRYGKNIYFPPPNMCTENGAMIALAGYELYKIGIRSKQNHAGQSSRSTYSPFSPQIAEWCMEYFLRDTTTIFDPFAGWGERHVAAKTFEKVYIG